MKKGIKIILIVSIVLVVIGILCVVIPAMSHKLDFREYSRTVSDIFEKNIGISFHGWADGTEYTEQAGELGDDIEDSIEKQLEGIIADTNADFNEIGSHHVIDPKGIKEIKIGWVSGVVEITSGSDDIEFYETASGISEPLSFDVHGDTLSISFAKDDFWSVTFSGYKKLYLSVPDNMLESLEIDSTSADVYINGLKTEEISADVVSGKTILENVELKELDVSSVSGAVEADGVIRDVNCSSVSGDIEITSSVCPRALDISTTSGAATLNIPGNSSFTLEAESVSGDIDSDFDLLYSTKSEKYIVGKGECEFEFSSISGNLKIYAN